MEQTMAPISREKRLALRRAGWTDAEIGSPASSLEPTAGGRDPSLREMTRYKLIDKLWEETLLAWLGTSAGAITIVISTFWRWMMREPSLLIRYGDGETVWYFLGLSRGLVRGARPDVPVEATIIWLAWCFLGASVIIASSKPWRDIKNELKRRRCNQ